MSSPRDALHADGPASWRTEAGGDAGRPPGRRGWRPGWRWWGFAGAWWTVDGLLTATNYHRMGTPGPDGTRDWSALLPSLAGAWMWVPLSLGALWLAARFPIERGTWRRHLPLHVAAAAVVCLVRAGAVLVLNPWVRWYDAIPPVSDLLITSVANNLLLFGMLVGVGHALHFAARYRERDAQLARAELGALRMQLHPHFLFNTLNGAAAYVRSRPATAERMIGQLAGLLRHALDAARVEEIALAEELRLLAAYVEIEQVRFADRLTVRWEIAPDVSRALVPNLLLQPLVENAIRHGIAPRAAPGAVTIAAWRAEDELVLTITDDGVGFGRAARPAGVSTSGSAGEPRGTAGLGSGIGLATTRARLHHLYGPLPRATAAARRAAGQRPTVTRPTVERRTGDRRTSPHAPGERVTIEEPPGGGVRVSLRLPWRASADAVVADEDSGRDPRTRAPDCPLRVPPVRRPPGASASTARRADGSDP